jgi:hypothetical protein
VKAHIQLRSGTSAVKVGIVLAGVVLATCAFSFIAYALTTPNVTLLSAISKTPGVGGNSFPLEISPDPIRIASLRSAMGN